jgi:hypothetical protein
VSSPGASIEAKRSLRSQQADYTRVNGDCPYVHLAASPGPLHGHTICIGNPGIGSLESHRGPNTHPLIYYSIGELKGGDTKDKTRTLHDNSPMGWLIHDCWTYWGHSGGPLLSIEPLPTTPHELPASSSSSSTNSDSKSDGVTTVAAKKSRTKKKSNDQLESLRIELVGLHNSWDGYHGCDIGDTTTRHGIPVDAIHAFLSNASIKL